MNNLPIFSDVHVPVSMGERAPSCKLVFGKTKQHTGTQTKLTEAEECCRLDATAPDDGRAGVYYGYAQTGGGYVDCNHQDRIDPKGTELTLECNTKKMKERLFYVSDGTNQYQKP